MRGFQNRADVITILSTTCQAFLLFNLEAGEAVLVQAVCLGSIASAYLAL